MRGAEGPYPASSLLPQAASHWRGVIGGSPEDGDVAMRNYPRGVIVFAPMSSRCVSRPPFWEWVPLPRSDGKFNAEYNLRRVVATAV